MVAVLHQRNFALLTAGQMISKLGDWLLWIGLPFAIYEQTASPLATGLMFVMPTLPAILFGSLAGIFVDQHDRKWTLVWADLLRALTVAALFFLSEQLWLVYLLVFIEATLAQFFYPAKSALLPQLVGSAQLLAANRVTSLGDDLINLIGPALGGLLPALLGIRGVIGLDAGSFLLSALCIGLIRFATSEKNPVTLHPAQAPLEKPGQSSWQLVKTQPLVVRLLPIMAVAMVGQGIISVCWIVFVRTVLQAGAPVYGWVQVAVALGGLGGALMLGRASRWLSAVHLVGLGGSVTGLLLLATFNWPVLPAIFVLQFVMGGVGVAYFVTLETLLQTAVPDAALGRVFGIYRMTNGLAMLAGQGMGSLLGTSLGAPLLLNVAALLYLAAGLLALMRLPAVLRGSEALLRPAQESPAILQ